MFEILFRGKVSGMKKWVTGDFVKTGNTANIATKGYELFPVEPETVTAYINRKDNDGNFIFVGDVVEISGRAYNEPWEYCVLVTFNEKTLQVELRYVDANVSQRAAYIGVLDGGFKLRVLGNRFDNPELLTKKSETVFVYGGA